MRIDADGFVGICGRIDRYRNAKRPAPHNLGAGLVFQCRGLFHGRVHRYEDNRRADDHADEHSQDLHEHSATPYPTQRRTSSAASIPRAEATFCQLESSAGRSLHIWKMVFLPIPARFATASFVIPESYISRSRRWPGDHSDLGIPAPEPLVELPERLLPQAFGGLSVRPVGGVAFRRAVQVPPVARTEGPAAVGAPPRDLVGHLIPPPSAGTPPGSRRTGGISSGPGGRSSPSTARGT